MAGDPRFISLGIPASGLLVAALTFESAGARIKSRPVTFLTKCTYAIYLCHWFVNIVSERIVAEGDGSLVLSLLVLFVAPLVVTAVAIVVYLSVEAPTTAYFIRRFAGSKASDKAAGVRLASSH